MALLNDVMVGTERVLSTPVSFNIASIFGGRYTPLLVPANPPASPAAHRILDRHRADHLALRLFASVPALCDSGVGRNPRHRRRQLHHLGSVVHWTRNVSLRYLFIVRAIKTDKITTKKSEQPFGLDPNDLPLESYCAQIAAELDVLASRPKPRISEWTEHLENKVLFPYSNAGWHAWLHHGETKIRQALRAKTELEFGQRSRMMGQEHGKNEGGSGHAHGHGRSVSKPQAAEKISDVENGLGSRQ